MTHDMQVVEYLATARACAVLLMLGVLALHTAPKPTMRLPAFMVAMTAAVLLATLTFAAVQP